MRFQITCQIVSIVLLYVCLALAVSGHYSNEYDGDQFPRPVEEFSEPSKRFYTEQRILEMARLQRLRDQARRRLLGERSGK
ncbi:hypothetical protein P879_05600 [Paragonimus westermani]|uniref:Corticotropin-releasing factor domain-containing protein n=1 Tax=Paragonimus westermani TaxID=34504 RepID=A0A8T0DSP0_9TREM|nr:hypothetical protein P879_05600 [Paragonimus westermani]